MAVLSLTVAFSRQAVYRETSAESHQGTAQQGPGGACVANEEKQ
jgi:hypothetical protein